ncbi:type 1 glutamine amidotransferase [Brevibacterium spongiae]|uniref:Type 1 glutamine amidotransferase n=1 Tax=Brevibacterium spongiae TaxID=2909672 RepID=A0ABY5SNK7_9MICO|nr:type 1 glutamine amidotransferase [Brevibacterium spongiae]UVI36167.1 type 1 glutamine amidotransferase [Brevibacterium spongiae]
MSTVRILVIEHERGTGPERFGRWLEESGAEVVVTRPYLGEVIPAEALTAEALPARALNRDPNAPAAGSAGSFDALIVLGGAAGPLEDADNPWFPKVRDLLRASIDGEFPSLNICLGGEMLAVAGDAPITRRAHPQIGIYELETTSAGEADPVFGSLSDRALPSVLFHQEEMALPAGAELLITGSDAPVQAFRLGEFAWGTQFHPETDAAQVTRWLGGNDLALPAGKTEESIIAEVEDADEELQNAGRALAGAFVEFLVRRSSQSVRA